MVFISFPVEEIIIPCSTPKLYLANSLAAALREPAL